MTPSSHSLVIQATLLPGFELSTIVGISANLENQTTTISSPL